MRKKSPAYHLKITAGRTPVTIVTVFFATLVGYFVGLESHTPAPLPITSENPHIKLCFTPGGKCQNHVITALNTAKKSIFVQAYSFSSKPIADALIQAQKRGLRVQVLADRSQLTEKYSLIPYLKSKGIKVSIDSVPGIAHSKIMIIDDELILAGSYNWTNAAETRNAENLLFITDPKVAQRYLENFKTRLQLSEQEG